MTSKVRDLTRLCSNSLTQHPHRAPRNGMNFPEHAQHWRQDTRPLSNQHNQCLILVEALGRGWGVTPFGLYECQSDEHHRPSIPTRSERNMSALTFTQFHKMGRVGAVITSHDEGHIGTSGKQRAVGGTLSVVCCVTERIARSGELSNAVG